MPAAKINQILTYIKSQIVANVSSAHAERTKIGPINPAEITGDPQHRIFQGAETYKIKDGGKTEIFLNIIIGALVRIDPEKAESQLEQLNEEFALVIAQMETIADGDCNGLCKYMKPDGPMEIAGADDKDSLVYAAMSYEIRYERTRGAIT